MLTDAQREDLQTRMAQCMIEGMDLDTLIEYGVNCLTCAYRELSEEEFLDDVRENAPHLLDD